MCSISRVEQLEALYSSPRETSVAKETTALTPDYQALIEASPFLVVATSGPDGLDCSPRGDKTPVVQIADDRTLYLPDRRGNNRIDSLRNLIVDPRIAMLFLLPGCGLTLRVNGKATISVAPEILSRFAVDEIEPRTVLIVSVEQVFFQCARAIIRSDLWNSEKHIHPDSIPSAGTILENLSTGEFDGQKYDDELPDRARKTLW